MTAIATEGSLTERYSEPGVSGEQFGIMQKERWESIVLPILEVMENGIERNVLTALEAGKVFSCVTGELFGYPEFHGGVVRANPHELIPALLDTAKKARG